uniref:Uncharacterized protein n=1 Tax=Arundo donax TaxID=35708 RepID=A0A0A9HMZ8_ARUDO
MPIEASMISNSKSVCAKTCCYNYHDRDKVINTSKFIQRIFINIFRT